MTKTSSDELSRVEILFYSRKTRTLRKTILFLFKKELRKMNHFNIKTTPKYGNKEILLRKLPL